MNTTNWNPQVGNTGFFLSKDKLLANEEKLFFTNQDAMSGPLFSLTDSEEKLGKLNGPSPHKNMFM